jgi:hypothetical protein
MSRLDSMIRRLLAQRACLEAVAEMIEDLPGPVLEIGLGNGRTYDHLRERLPERTILVFDRVLPAHPGCIPPLDTFFLGELETTLPLAYKRIGRTAVLAHADIGSGRDDHDSANAALLARLLPPMLRARALVVGDQQLHCAELKPEALPEGIPTGRYFLYRCIK